MTEGKGGLGMGFDGWNEQELSKIADVIDCKHRTPKYVEDGIPLVAPGNISWGKLSFDGCKQVSLKEYQALMDHCHVQIGDMVMSRNQSFGVAAYISDDKPFVLGQDTVLIQANETESKYLYQYLQSTLFQRSIQKLSAGSTFKRINLGDIRRLKVVTPSKLEQRKIADILSTWDEAIETLEKLIKAKEKRKRALMQGLLTGKKRFKEFAGLEWQQTRLEEYIFEVTDRNAGGAIEQVLSITNTAGFVLPDEVFSKRVASKNIENYKVVRRGQFAYNPSRINVGSLAYLHAFEVGVISPMYVVFDVKSGLSKDFLFHWFGSDEAVKNIAQSTQGSVRDSVNYSALANFEIKVPKLAEQKAITHVLNLADAEISNLQRGLELYKRQKRGLMQELLTGKTRVKVDEGAP